VDSGASTPLRSAQHDRDTPGKVRLFAAVDLGEAVCTRAEQAAEKVHALAHHAKWAHDGGFHLTLFFFGWVESERVPAVEEALGSAVRGHRPMRLSVKGSGTFGSSKKPRVLWLGLAGDIEPLARLQASVSSEVSKLGFVPEDRPFAPHLTLARARDPHGDPGLARCRDALAEFDCGEGTVAALTLYRSELSPKGAKYTVWRSFPLGG
jgi:2'-5' RNA ligase